MKRTSEEFKEEVISWGSRIGVKPKEVHVREMKRKWAGCSTSGSVTFSIYLLRETRKKRDEVIVHEL